MDFDWTLYPDSELSPDDVSETFEDPFSLRFLPDSGPIADQSRFFCLGKSIKGQGLFSIYRSTGKVITILFARPMTEDEDYFYRRMLKEST
ncbi:MAG: hypothetical protein AAFY98_03565 [Verrucomicrobiota bacterium]